MSQGKAFLDHHGPYWSGIFSFLRSRGTYFAKNETDSGPPNDDDSTDPDFDELWNVKLPEVLQAKKIITPQLYREALLNEIKPDHICNLFLDRSLARDLFGRDCPPEIFGKVLEIYPPYDPDLQYPMEYVNMQVPRKGRKATIVSVPANIIRSYPTPVSWLIKIPVWGATLDLSELEDYIDFFATKGIQVETHFDPEDLRLLYTNSITDPLSVPWLFIVTSDWLSSLPPEEYESSSDKLKILLFEQKARIINYHPRPGIILNDVWNFLHGEGTTFFLDSHSMLNLIQRVESELNRFLIRRM